MTVMTSLHDFSDIHTHGRTGPDIITSVEPIQGMDGEYGHAWYSVGIHPWSTAAPVPESEFELLEQMIADPRTVAVGECGFDRNRGGSQDYQRGVFLRHVALSEKYRKPLVIHCVGRYGLLMDLHRQLHPSQLWIAHGFTGKPELARQLAAAGIALSVGARSRPEISAVVPSALLFHESDSLPQNN